MQTRECALYVIRALMKSHPEGWPEHRISVSSPLPRTRVGRHPGTDP